MRRLSAVEFLSSIFFFCLFVPSSTLVGAAHIRWGRESLTLLTSLERPQTPSEAHFPSLRGSCPLRLTVTTTLILSPAKRERTGTMLPSALASALLRGSR